MIQSNLLSEVQRQSPSSACLDGSDFTKHEQSLSFPEVDTLGMTMRLAGKSSCASQSSRRRKSRKTSSKAFVEFSKIGVFALAADLSDATHRTVSFAKNLVTKEIPQPFFFEEIASAQWYDQNELQQIRRECEQIIDMLKKDEAPLGQQYCKRGLESHFRKELSFLKNTEEIRNEILDAQVELWSDDRLDSIEDLAEIYRLHSTQYAIKARVTGLHDWKSVQEDN